MVFKSLYLVKKSETHVAVSVIGVGDDTWVRFIPYSFRNLTRHLSEECNVFLTASERNKLPESMVYLTSRRSLSSIDYIRILV